LTNEFSLIKEKNHFE